ncbi:MAG: glucosaminidase domain-containing protein, partial [Ferruginibacter sp.]
MYKLVITFLISVISITATAQRVSVEEYIEQFKDIAISEMKRSGVPASITLAQGILESENGNSELVKRSNNHFGIKCKSTWNGESVTHDDDATGECFRAYTNADESYRDHSDFLKVNKRYGSLFILDPTDYAGWAKGLKKAGYATNPRYPDLLIKYIEQYNLQQYSLAALNALPGNDLARPAVDGNTNQPSGITGEKTGGPQMDQEIKADPDKLSSINNTKCVFVKKGTSLLAVANANNISLYKLMQFNDMTEEGLLAADQYIYLQKKPRTGEKEFYFAQPGETVHEVAQHAGIQLAFLLAYNHLSAGTTFN